MTAAVALELDLEGDLLESGERRCASQSYREVIAHADSFSCVCPYCVDRVYVGVKFDSNHPTALAALSLDKSAISPEHDPRDSQCACEACDIANRERTQKLSQWLLEDHEALAVQIENDQLIRSNAPTSRAPAMSVSESAELALEPAWEAV